MSAPTELTLFSGGADGECHRCREVYEIKAFAAFHDDCWTCPTCAGALSPGMDEIIHGLDRVYDAVTLDLLTRKVLIKDLGSVTWALRKLADLIDDIAADRAVLHLSVKVVDGIAPHEDGQPIGISIDREITRKEISA
ncbi:hypothetical protein ACIBEJ_48780 [Nonomuraea sp. NPDC050790]|uniref:hypothetical protein n=1 Tax=Nonomuraea sp. NPDC050790 TaxID=3364371 RepID=UPI0037AD6954